MWWKPKRIQWLYENNLKACREGGDLIAAAGFLLAFFIACASKAFILIAVNPLYYGAIEFLPWMCCIWALKNAGESLDGGCYISHTNRIMLINSLSACLVIIGFYYILPIYGSWGAIYVLMGTFFIRTLLLLMISELIISVRYRYIRLSIFAFLSFILSIALFFIQNMIAFIISSLIVGLLLAFAGIQMGLFPPLSSLFKMDKSG